MHAGFIWTAPSVEVMREVNLALHPEDRQRLIEEPELIPAWVCTWRAARWPSPSRGGLSLIPNFRLDTDTQLMEKGPIDVPDDLRELAEDVAGSCPENAITLSEA